jgi:hypothetical protein
MTIVDEARGNLDKGLPDWVEESHKDSLRPCPYCKMVGEHACNCWAPNETQAEWNTAYWRIIDGEVMFWGLSHEAVDAMNKPQARIKELEAKLEAVGRHLTGKDR